MLRHSTNAEHPTPLHSPYTAAKNVILLLSLPSPLPTTHTHTHTQTQKNAFIPDSDISIIVSCLCYYTSSSYEPTIVSQMCPICPLQSGTFDHTYTCKVTRSSLKSGVYYMYHKGLTFQNSTLCPEIVFVCCLKLRTNDYFACTASTDR